MFCCNVVTSCRGRLAAVPFVDACLFFSHTPHFCRSAFNLYDQNDVSLEHSTTIHFHYERSFPLLHFDDMNSLHISRLRMIMIPSALCSMDSVANGLHCVYGASHSFV